MDSSAVPVLWLCGPPGVGKTTVAWQIYAGLANAGLPVGYVDIDQLGICDPGAAADPHRHRLKATNLDAVVAGYGAAGAQGVVVSGVVDAERGVVREHLPHALVTTCRLRANTDVLQRRLIERRRVEDMAAVLGQAEALDRSQFADFVVDTTTVSAVEVARLVAKRTPRWHAQVRGRRLAQPAETGFPTDGSTDGSIVWLCGATGVGKSTVGFALYQRTVKAGIPTAYLDLDQVGFCRPAPHDDPGHHCLRAGNLLALWRNLRAVGTQGLVLVGPAEDERTIQTYRDVLPAARMTVCRLHAQPDELRRRIMARGRGGSWAQPGDPLVGQPAESLGRLAAEAIAQADLLERASVGDRRIDTSGLLVEQAVDAIVAGTGWPLGGLNEQRH